jgi:hypothetical protein
MRFKEKSLEKSQIQGRAALTQAAAPARTAALLITLA